MTTYRAFPSTNGAAIATAYSGNFISGMGCMVTKGGCWAQGIHVWCCNSGQATVPVKVALLSVGSIGAGQAFNVLATATSSTLIAGTWNYVPFANPVQLAIGDYLSVQVGVNGAFADTVNWFGTNAPTGITNGPLFVFNGSGNTSLFNGGYANNWGFPQGNFSTAITDPATGYAGSISGTDNFWVDLQISDQIPVGYSGSYRLWPGMRVVDNLTSADSAVPYTIATEFYLSQQCVINKIWFWTLAGATTLPGVLNIWSIDPSGLTGTALYTGVVTPANWSGAAGSQQWISAAVNGLTLNAGKYKVSVYDNTTTDAWGAKRLGYWGQQTGEAPGAVFAPNGITNGPLYAPPTALASTCYSYQPASGTPTEPGQNSFAVGPPQLYPNQYVGQFSTAGDLFQNYWVDVEVTPTGPVQNEQDYFLQRIDPSLRIKALP